MLDKLYQNVGKLLQRLAKGAFVVETIASIICGIAFVVEPDDTPMLWIGIAMIFLGWFVAFALSLPLYGFGILVEKAENTPPKSNDNEPKKTVPEKKSPEKAVAEEIVIDEEQSITLACPYCRDKTIYSLKQLKNRRVVCPQCAKAYKFDYKQYINDAKRLLIKQKQ